jgi:hypothetical protein
MYSKDLKWNKKGKIYFGNSIKKKDVFITLIIYSISKIKFAPRSRDVALISKKEIFFRQKKISLILSGQNYSSQDTLDTRFWYRFYKRDTKPFDCP